MVVLLDLDEDMRDPHADPSSYAFPRSQLNGAVNTTVKTADRTEDTKERPNPNINGFSAALGCYPIVCQISHSLDLNTLHALSRTCRQIRFNLLQHQRQLIAQSLRCDNDTAGNGARANHENGSWKVFGHESVPICRLTSGKVGACARDMVSDCRRCGRIVCRNCTMKSPSSTSLPKRHRRLCSICISTPISTLTYTLSPDQPVDPATFATPAFTQDPCTCTTSVFLCLPCGRALAEKDTTYNGVWTWRARYSRLGTGIGEGNEGVKCGRGEDCLGAKDTEVEIDCGADELSSPQLSPSRPSSSAGSSVAGTSAAGEDVLGGESSPERDKVGYWRQEVEGIGGVVKKKVKKRVRVGKTVIEYEDERETSSYLDREIRGDSRSWCGWCGRVILGKRDLENMVTKG